MASNLKQYYGEAFDELIDALVGNPEKDTFLLEWDLLEYDKI